jgi:hypothetical protein
MSMEAEAVDGAMCGLRAQSGTGGAPALPITQPKSDVDHATGRTGALVPAASTDSNLSRQDFVGEPGGDRTRDHMIKSHVLYH